MLGAAEARRNDRPISIVRGATGLQARKHGCFQVGMPGSRALAGCWLMLAAERLPMRPAWQARALSFGRMYRQSAWASVDFLLLSAAEWDASTACAAGRLRDSGNSP